jgi:hypothetical protein
MATKPFSGTINIDIMSVRQWCQVEALSRQHDALRRRSGARSRGLRYCGQRPSRRLLSLVSWLTWVKSECWR